MPIAAIGGALIGGIGGLFSGGAASRAASAQAAATRAAAERASRMAQFRPVGLRTGLGSSNFTVNDLGQVTEAGYTLAPSLQNIQGRLLTGAEQYDPYRLQQLTEPIYGGVESLLSLGGSYLGANPQEVAAKYISERQGLLAPSRAAEFGRINARNFATGRGGLGVQTGTGGAPSNPALQAYYNSIFQQDKALAAEADQAAMDRIRFGGELYGAGGKLAAGIPSLFSGSFLPLETQLKLSQSVESLGQQPFLLSQDLAKSQAASGAQAGNIYQTGMTNAAGIQAKADSYSPFGSFLSGAGSSISGLGGGGGGGGFGSLSGLFGGGGYSGWESALPSGIAVDPWSAPTSSQYAQQSFGGLF